MDYISGDMLSSAFVLLIIVICFFSTGNYVLKDLVKSISEPLGRGLCIVSSRQPPGNTVIYFYIISCIG